MTSTSFEQENLNASLDRIGENLLRSEIEFWQEIIETCPVTQPPESIERMHQALALAESRLEKLCGT